MKKLLIAAFFAALALVAALTFCLPSREFSENENRNLAQAPTLTLDRLLSGDFQEELDAFLSDQIPLRDFWIRANTALNKALGRKELGGVYLGSDGYYLQKFTDSDYSAARRDAVFALIERFAQNSSVNVSIMPIPTPGLVLQSKLPANAPMYDGEKVWQALAAAAPSVRLIDLRESFGAATEQLYYRTDHHWTAQGAYLAYRQYCAELGLTAKPLEAFGLEQVSDSFLGTLYSKTLDGAARREAIWAPQTLPQVTVTLDGGASGSLYAPEYLQQKDQYAYFFGGNWGRVDIHTPTENGKTLVVFKDSFANSFVPYLLADYQHIVMLDLRYFGGSISEAVAGATEILFLYEMTNLLTDTGLNKLAR